MAKQITINLVTPTPIVLDQSSSGPQGPPGTTPNLDPYARLDGATFTGEVTLNHATALAGLTTDGNVAAFPTNLTDAAIVTAKHSDVDHRFWVNADGSIHWADPSAPTQGFALGPIGSGSNTWLQLRPNGSRNWAELDVIGSDPSGGQINLYADPNNPIISTYADAGFPAYALYEHGTDRLGIRLQSEGAIGFGGTTDPTFWMVLADAFTLQILTPTERNKPLVERKGVMFYDDGSVYSEDDTAGSWSSLNPDGSVNVFAEAATEVFRVARPGGDNTPAYRTFGDGKMEWAAGDATLERLDQGALKFTGRKDGHDHSFFQVGDDTVAGYTYSYTDGGNHSSVYAENDLVGGGLGSWAGIESQGRLEIQTVEAGRYWLAVTPPGMATHKFASRDDGQLEWGDGVSVRDTILRRISAGTLFLDGATFEVGAVNDTTHSVIGMYQGAFLGVYSATIGNAVLDTSLLTDTATRFGIGAGGDHFWSSGTAGSEHWSTLLKPAELADAALRMIATTDLDPATNTHIDFKFSQGVPPLITLGGNGGGIKLTSPDGLTTKTLTINNAGALTLV